MPLISTLPDEIQAFQFATMLHAGLPASEAITYFTDSTDIGELAHLVRAWTRSRAVRKATLQLIGKPWQELSEDEMMKTALGLHYRQLSTLLYTTNYIEADPQTKTKMDEARKALESKLAGTAGQMNALDRFYEDMRAGKFGNLKPLGTA